MTSQRPAIVEEPVTVRIHRKPIAPVLDAERCNEALEIARTVRGHGA